MNKRALTNLFVLMGLCIVAIYLILFVGSGVKVSKASPDKPLYYEQDSNETLRKMVVILERMEKKVDKMKKQLKYEKVD